VHPFPALQHQECLDYKGIDAFAYLYF